MQYISKYKSPLGTIILSADDTALTGLWFENQKYCELYLQSEHKEKELPVLTDAKHWLDIYFSGKEPDFKLPLHFSGSDFQNEVWQILSSIPYGKTISYGKIAEIIAKKRGIKQMSARAVGNAVGKNKISIIVPCHRVIGSNGNITGYAGGVDRKIKLLMIENNNLLIKAVEI